MAGMKTTGRAGRLFSEQAGQLLFVASGFLDRLILSAVIIRFWGINDFETWSTCIAIAGLVNIFELGFNFYFNNQIMIFRERGEDQQFERTLAIGNTIFASISACAIISSLLFIWFFDPVGAGDDLAFKISASAISVAAGARLAMCAINALYRANRQYARFAFILAFAEILRVLTVLISILVGFDIVNSAINSSVMTISALCVFVYFDTRKRFAPHRHRFAIPSSAEFVSIIKMSLLFFGNILPITIWTSVPVLFLQSIQLAAGLLGAFILIRTLASVARTPMQSLGIVYGQECGRCIAVGDLSGALRVLRSGARLFSVLSGLLSGLLLVAGANIIQIWSGGAASYDEALMVAAVAPLLLVTMTVLVDNVLMGAQSPARSAIARWVQMTTTVLTYALLNDLNPSLRMMVALAVGEIVGYAPIAYHAMARLIPGAGLVFHIRNIVVVIASAGLGGLTVKAVFYCVGTSGFASIAAALVLTGAIYGLYLLAFGVGGNDRKLMWTQVILPLLIRLRLVRSPR